MKWLALPGIALLLLAGSCAAVTFLARRRSMSRLLQGMGRREIILSFDDGPSPHHTAALLDILLQNGVRALFFVTAENARQHPALVHRMAAEGHLVGLHGLRHKNPWLWGLLPPCARRDVVGGARVLEDLGISPAFFRPAWGRLTPFTAYYARRAGLPLLFWNVMAEDWQGDATAFSIEQRLRARCGDKAVICLHDAGHRGRSDAPAQTAAALRTFIPNRIRQGWRFVLPRQSAGARKGAA